jgi:homopolymeric O-antigen transport system ATP-binding protein
MSAAVSVEHLSKTYRLGMIGGSTLAGDLARWWARVRHQPDPLLKVGEGPRPRRIGDEFRALQDVSFDVAYGDVLGVIGRNGAGKSTVLKILSQVTAPTFGRVTLKGRVASLLEVGTGFHPELSGRENVFLNGAIMGMTKAEIRRKFDEIVAFSECEAFIDTPVKRYSSGMHVRLAFAVAAHLEPEILIVDEVLAVGDVTFQQKCLGKMRDVSRQGRTILFVSHNMSAVSTLCNRAILLNDGKVVLDGDTNTVVGAYQSDRTAVTNTTSSLAEQPRRGTGKGTFCSLSTLALSRAGDVLPDAIPGCDLVVEVAIECLADFSAAQVAVMMFDSNAYRVIDANTALRGDFVSLKQGQRATVTFHLDDLLLKPGTYYIGLWLGRGALEEIDYVEDAGSFRVVEDPASVMHTETFPGVYQCRFTHTTAVTGKTAP